MKTVRFLKPYKQKAAGETDYLKNHAANKLIAAGVAELDVKKAPVRQAVVDAEQMTTREEKPRRRTRRVSEDA